VDHSGPPLKVFHTVPPLGWQNHRGMANEMGMHCYEHDSGLSCLPKLNRPPAQLWKNCSLNPLPVTAAMVTVEV
jgi:hypothetical protein